MPRPLASCAASSASAVYASMMPVPGMRMHAYESQKPPNKVNAVVPNV